MGTTEVLPEKACFLQTMGLHATVRKQEGMQTCSEQCYEKL